VHLKCVTLSLRHLLNQYIRAPIRADQFHAESVTTSWPSIRCQSSFKGVAEDDPRLVRCAGDNASNCSPILDSSTMAAADFVTAVHLFGCVFPFGAVRGECCQFVIVVRLAATAMAAFSTLVIRSGICGSGREWHSLDGETEVPSTLPPELDQYSPAPGVDHAQRGRESAEDQRLSPIPGIGPGPSRPVPWATSGPAVRQAR